jgi:sterol desaturase/sphingolipid hydroxylase (fatty acid hydroxylase superfamily)
MSPLTKEWLVLQISAMGLVIFFWSGRADEKEWGGSWVVWLTGIIGIIMILSGFYLHHRLEKKHLKEE